jgi:hypothetical protein
MALIDFVFSLFVFARVFVLFCIRADSAVDL